MDIVKLLYIGHQALQSNILTNVVDDFAATNGYGFAALKNMRKGHMMLVDAVWQHQLSDINLVQLEKADLTLASALWVLFSSSANIREIDDICLSLKSFSHPTDGGLSKQDGLLRALIAKRSAIDSSQNWVLEHHESEVWDWYWSALRA